MGLSFRKSITILPGVKINLSKSGVGVSAGVKGLRASINSKGQVRGTASIPGTGVRYTKTKNVKNMLSGSGKDDKKTKKTKSKESEKAVKKAAPAEQPTEREEIVTPQMQKLRAESSEPAPFREELPSETYEEQTGDIYERPEKGDISDAILSMYAVADRNIDWGAINSGSADPAAYPNFSYLKNRAAKVLDGDIDTYLEIISDTNPFDEFIACGSEFSCSTENPMKMHVDFTVNTDTVFADLGHDKDLIEDYVCGVAIKAARDIFALLPVWSVSLTALDGAELMDVSFTRDSFEELNFSKIDASDTVRKFGGRINIQ